MVLTVYPAAMRAPTDSRHGRRGRCDPVRGILVSACLGLLLALPTEARETERLYLSGIDAADAVDWEFRCHHGRDCGSWTTIPVPSNWELHGFGQYNYGHDEPKAQERGDYRHRFHLPDHWSGQRVWLVFEGVMTDATVRLNGRSAGPTHQGAFYRFRYDVTELVEFGEGENLLEVRVDRESRDGSVNRAERDADYWVFGGIFRPVYLEAEPQSAIGELAVDARHQGHLDVEIDLRVDRHAERPDLVTGWIETLSGQRVGASFGALVGPTNRIRLATLLPDIESWNPERPQLYDLVTELRAGTEVLHRRRERIGFRSVEVRADGFYLNGRRTLLRGINRHSFHPDSGRATSRVLSRRDAELIAWLNANAVRSSHYPPDRHFLDACDELGLLVIDELTGWHDAYSTRSGTPLVHEMVTFDRNHPSVVLWANGNESGWNVRLDPMIRSLDPQKRPVVHPDAIFGGFDTRHYPNWSELAARLDGSDRKTRGLVLPTEMLHGLYDGGHAAGLSAFWSLIESSPRAAGGFLWALFDEGVVRADAEDRRIDTDGNHAPDGLVGPYRQLEASAYGVREQWAPLRIQAPEVSEPGAPASLRIENRFDHSRLDTATLRWEIVAFPGPSTDLDERRIAAGQLALPALDPRTTGELSLAPIWAAWDQNSAPLADSELPALRLVLIDGRGRPRGTWVFPLENPAPTPLPPTTSTSLGSFDDVFELAAGPTRLSISRHDGRLVEVRHADRILPLRGPFVATWEAAAGPEDPDPPEVGIHLGNHVQVSNRKGLRSFEWSLDPDGSIVLSYELSPASPGLGFRLPEGSLLRFRRLAEGPYRTWGNRTLGRRLGLWETTINASNTGVVWDYPESNGYHSGVRWASFDTTFGGLVLDLADDPRRFLQVLSPNWGPDPRHTLVEMTPFDLAVLHRIPSIGTKFHPAEDLSPPAVTYPGASATDRHTQGTIRLRFPRPDE